MAWRSWSRRAKIAGVLIIAALGFSFLFALAGVFYSFGLWFPALPSTIATTNPIAGPSSSVSGIIRQGVEAGCVMLHADNGSDYLLLGRSSYPPPGTTVVVTGYVENDAITTCMEGIAFHVTVEPSWTPGSTWTGGSGTSYSCAAYQAQFGAHCPAGMDVIPVGVVPLLVRWWLVLLLLIVGVVLLVYGLMPTKRRKQ